MHKTTQNSPSISFEFFPPKTAEGLQNLQTTALKLTQRAPHFFSVTYGAGGSTQEKTLETVLQIKTTTEREVAPHLTCIASTKDKVSDLLEYYQERQINRMVALRGDLPANTDSHPGEFPYARDLVAFIRHHTKDYFHIAVAAYPEFHPETNHAQLSLKHFHEKVLAGADNAITQYFFNADAYFYFLDACEKLHIEIPVVPGIMPITNYHQLARFSQLCGAEIPRWLRVRLEHYGDDLESLGRYGEEVMTRLCEKLLAGGAPGLHFYTLNKAEPSLAILNNLKISSY